MNILKFPEVCLYSFENKTFWHSKLSEGLGRVYIYIWDSEATTYLFFLDFLKHANLLNHPYFILCFLKKDQLILGRDFTNNYRHDQLDLRH